MGGGGVCLEESHFKFVGCVWAYWGCLPALSVFCPVLSRFARARKKPININIFGGTVSGTNRNRPWDKWEPPPGKKWDPSLGQTGLSLFNSTVKSPFCPVCPCDGWGFVPGTIVPQGPSENVYVFYVYWFFVAPICDHSGLALSNKEHQQTGARSPSDFMG